MCGRYALYSPGGLIAEVMRLAEPPTIEPRFNIAPSQPAPVVRAAAGGERRLDSLRWGLVPSWSEDPVLVNRLINARAESAADKPAFREAFRRRRCLVPADGFYEWDKRDGHRLPHWIHRRDGGPLAFAALWEHWRGRDGALVESFAIVTCPPNEKVAALHDRMPVILPPQDFDLWLDPNSGRETLTARLLPCPDDDLEIVPLGPWVNTPANEGPRCLEPAAEPPPSNLSLF